MLIRSAPFRRIRTGSLWRTLSRAVCLGVGLGIGLASGLGKEATALDLQGHRGARGLLPENTLAAFAGALGIGVTTLEMDLGVTRDGVVVVTHNPRLDPAITRDAGGAWLQETGPAIRALPLAEVRAYNVGGIQPGSRYASRFPQQKSLAHARIPTLAEVIGLVRRSGNGSVRLNLETKLSPEHPEETPDPADFVRSILQVVEGKGFPGRITLQSFDWRTLREMQRMAPEVPTVYLTVQQDWLDNIQRGKPGASPWMAGVDIDDHNGSIPAAIKASGGRVWSPYHKEVTPESIAEAHRLSLKVVVWTVNQPARMESLIAMGVDGIITDYPDKLRGVLTRLGHPVPKPTPVSP